MSVHSNESGSVCQYSIYSLHLYAIIPVFILCRNFGFSTISCSIFAVFNTPPLIHLLFVTLSKYGWIKLVTHDNPKHKHDFITSLKVALQSIFLEIVLITGCRLVELSRYPEYNYLNALGLNFVLLSLFHFTEFFVTSLTNPDTLEPKSFLLNNSIAYNAAVLLSLLEFYVETLLYPELKYHPHITKLGLMVCIVGELIRKLGMFTAGENFTHHISTFKNERHKLVTNGVYSVFRHPAYAGWFYWALGTQIVLLNPICFVLYFILARQFFKERIETEEYYLVRFFGSEYLKYKNKVKVWIPI